tara:strand:- start:36657 stop:37286 length:630 start_codon:yes stop_codon:yes gene_type:complete
MRPEPPPFKRQRRKELRPDEIISAALMEFREKGYAATSMGSIAARAKIARSTVYLYFPDKEALVRQAFKDRIAGIFDRVQVDFTVHDGDFEQMFRAMLTLIYTEMVGSDAVELLRILIAEGARFPALLKFYHETVLSRIDAILGLMVANGIKSGALRPEIAQFDRKIIVAPVVVAAVWQLTFEAFDPLDMPGYIDGHVDLLTKGLLMRF